MRDEAFIEKIRSIQFRRGPAPPKHTVHHTDTAVVTETERTDRAGDHMDVLVQPQALPIPINNEE